MRSIRVTQSVVETGIEYRSSIPNLMFYSEFYSPPCVYIKSTIGELNMNDHLGKNVEWGGRSSLGPHIGG